MAKSGKPCSRTRMKKMTKRKAISRTTREYPKAPPGYVFLPKGDAYLTRKCTTLSNEAGWPVHIVYDKAETRIGLHIATHIWNNAQIEAAATADKRQAAVIRKEGRDRVRAREALRKKYPNMPQEDLEKVLNHAFEKGSGRVGRTGRETAERKASLAVGAHLRHNYTNYDSLLREMSREEARKIVGRKVLDIKAEWCGKAKNVR